MSHQSTWYRGMILVCKYSMLTHALNLFQDTRCTLKIIADKSKHWFDLLKVQVLGILKSHGGTSSFSSQPDRASVFLRCPSSPAWLRCHTQSAPSHGEACGADSWDGMTCHICYSCHRLQETSHKWSGLWVSEDVRLVSRRHSGLPMPTPPLNPLLTTTNPHLISPFVSSLSPSLLIVTVWQWKTVRAAASTVQWFLKLWQFWKKTQTNLTFILSIIIITIFTYLLGRMDQHLNVDKPHRPASMATESCQYF